MDEFSHRKPVIFHRGLMAAAFLLLSLAGCEALGLGKKKETPIVPPPPRRKTVEDPPAKTARPASPPVGLDGSAASDGSTSAPTAPAIDGAQTPAGTSTAGNPSPRAGSATAAGPQGAGGSDAADDSDTEGEADTSEPAKSAAKPRQIVQVGGRRTVDDPARENVEDPGADVIAPIEIEGAGAHFKKGQVAAVVNGVPIFAEDVLRTLPEELTRKLELGEKAVASGELKPEEFQNFRRMLVENFLQPHIQQEVLLQALKTKLKKDVLDGITKQLDAQFNKEYLPKVLKDKGYASTVELERALQKQGSTIETIRAGFRNKQLAQQYLGSKATAHDGFDRPDILEYYEEHREDYAITAKARWEQIQLKFSKYGGRDGALESREIIQRLENGEVFAVVARECSDGTTKSKGGYWGWTTRGSVKSKVIDKALFEQPVGEIGSPLETENSFEIIRVTDRTDADYQRFDDVHDDIKAHLKQAQFQRRVNELLKDLLENATIEKFTDKL